PLGLISEQLVVQDAQRRGNFLTFRREDATQLKARLLEAGLVVDARGDRLRFGFGLYHDIEYVDAVLERVRSA
ncbi:MAG: kynureninase, partial [Myxococcota bacterium]